MKNPPFRREASGARRALPRQRSPRCRSPRGATKTSSPPKATPPWSPAPPPAPAPPQHPPPASPPPRAAAPREPAAGLALFARAWPLWGGPGVGFSTPGAAARPTPAASWPFERKLAELLAVAVTSTMLLARHVG